VNPSECENVAKKSCIFIILEKEMDTICRMEDGQTCPDVCRSMKLPPSLLVPASVFQYCRVFFFVSVYILC